MTDSAIGQSGARVTWLVIVYTSVIDLMCISYVIIVAVSIIDLTINSAHNLTDEL